MDLHNVQILCLDFTSRTIGNRHVKSTEVHRCYQNQLYERWLRKIWRLVSANAFEWRVLKNLTSKYAKEYLLQLIDCQSFLSEADLGEIRSPK